MNNGFYKLLRTLTGGRITLFKNIGIYTILNLFSSSVPFILLPILTKNLSAESYGILDIFNNLGYIFLPLVGLNIGSSVIRFYYDRDELDFPKYISTILFFLIASGIIMFSCAIGLFYFFPQIKSSISFPSEVIIFAIIYALFTQLCQIQLSVWRAEQRPVPFGFFRISKTLLDLGLVIYFIDILGNDWEARINVAICVSVLFSLIAVGKLSKHLRLRFQIDYSYLKKSLVYSLPLIVHTLGSYIISFSDRFIILHFLDLEYVGLYAVAYQVGMIMSFVGNSFNQAWTPYFFGELKKNKIEIFKKLHKFNYIYALLMLVLAGIIFLLVPLFYDLFIGDEYEVSPWIIFWILLGYAFNGIYKMVVNYLFYYHQTKTLALITLLAAVTNIGLTYFLVPLQGITGAAIATTFAFLLMLVLVYFRYSLIYRQRLME